MLIRVSCLAAALLVIGSVARSETVTHVAPNGLRVTVCEDSKASLVEVELRYQAGSGLDEPGREGTAHLLEHLLMKSVVGRPKGGLQQSIFLNTVSANAWTDFDRLVFASKCLPSQLDAVLDIEVARAAGWAADPEELERERSVVLQEIAYRLRNTGMEDLREEIFAQEFEGHPYGRKVAGTGESVRAITAEDLVEFGRRWIQLDGASLAIVGPVRAAEVMARVDATLGSVDANRDTRVVPPLPAPRGSDVVIDRFDQPEILVARIHRMPLRDSKDFALARLLATLLRMGRQTPSVYGLGGEAWIGVGVGDWYAGYTPLGRTASQADADGLRAIADFGERIDRALRQLRTPRLFEKTRAKWIASLESSQRWRSRDVSELAEAAFDTSSIQDWDAALEIARTIELEEARAWVHEATSKARVSVGLAHGYESGRRRDIQLESLGSAGRETLADDPLVEIDPEQVRLAILDYQAARSPRLETIRLGKTNWTHLQLGHAKDLRLGGRIEVEGLKLEKPGKRPGISLAYGTLVNFGYRRMGAARRVSFRRRRLNYETHFWASPDDLQFGARCYPESTRVMIDTVRERLDSDSFDLQVWRWLLQSGKFNPSSESTSFLAAGVLGTDHPGLARWKLPRATLSKLEFEDVVDVHEQFTKKGSLALWTVGPLSTEELRPLLEEKLAGFGRREPPAPREIQVQPPEETLGKVVSQFERREIRMHMVAGVLPARSIDWATKALLGELVELRLQSHLRTKTGLAYWVFATVWDVGGRDAMLLQTGSVPDRAFDSFVGVLDVLRGLRTDPPQADEIERARLATLRNKCAALGSSGRAKDELARMLSQGHPPEDPYQALLSVDGQEVAALLAKALEAPPASFLISGAVLEDELDGYLRLLEEDRDEQR